MYNYNEDYLMHFGIKGMKWGVRRYQNKDGTLTAKGKKRYVKELRSELQTAGSQGKQWYEMSDDLARSDKFKQAIGSKFTEVSKARDKFIRMSNELEKSYRDNAKSLSNKKLNRLVDDEIKKNKDFYQSWKSRFFDKDGNPSEELVDYVKDGILEEHANKNKRHQEIEEAYNKAWKEYDKLRKDAVDDLLSYHKHDTIQIYDKTYGRTNNVSLDQIVEHAIFELDNNTRFEFYDD